MTFEFLALLVLRHCYPSAHGRFRVPGGSLGLAYVCLVPLGFVAVVLFVIFRDWRSFGGQFLVVGIVSAVERLCILSGAGSRPNDKTASSPD